MSKIYIPRIDFPGGDFIPSRVGIELDRDDKFVRVRLPNDSQIVFRWYEQGVRFFDESDYQKYSSFLIDESSFYKLAPTVNPDFLLMILKQENPKLWIQIKTKIKR
jgi:hypothetical protein